MGRDDGVVSTTSSISESPLPQPPSGVFFVAFLDDDDNNKDSSDVETLVRTRFGLKQPVNAIDSLPRWEEEPAPFDDVGVELGGVR